jgi:hypothetical protein
LDNARLSANSCVARSESLWNVAINPQAAEQPGTPPFIPGVSGQRQGLLEQHGRATVVALVNGQFSGTRSIGTLVVLNSDPLVYRAATNCRIRLARRPSIGKYPVHQRPEDPVGGVGEGPDAWQVRIGRLLDLAATPILALTNAYPTEAAAEDGIEPVPVPDALRNAMR